jgi:hypothetical protein
MRCNVLLLQKLDFLLCFSESTLVLFEGAMEYICDHQVPSDEQ